MKKKLFAALALSTVCLLQTFPAAAAPELQPHPTDLPLVRANDAGNPVPRFRREVNPPGLTLLDDRTSEVGFKSLFNGTDLTGWDGAKELWSVKDGAITGQTTKENPAKENTFLIWTNGDVGDFELRCEFKLVPGDSQGFANSGVQYRSKIVKPSYWVVAGYQADMEAGHSYTGQIYEEKGRAR